MSFFWLTGRAAYLRLIPMTNATRTQYLIESRIPGQTPWSPEGSGDTFTTRRDADKAVRSLEAENDEGEPLEYRVVEL